MRILSFLLAGLLLCGVAEAKKKKTPCEEASEKLEKYSQDNGAAIDACIDAEAIAGKPIPACTTHAKELVRLDQAKQKACK